jgi:indole-3-glycerol phosphate synthase
MAQYLSEIVAAHRAVAEEDRRDPDALEEAALAAPAATPFARTLAAVAAERGLAVIAEVKRRSPSKGDLAPGLDPAAVAAEYAAGGAACLSVLTDSRFFGGSPDDLVAARRAAGLPVLRKDFTVCRADVCDARLMGADAVLLIVAALGDDELASFLALAGRLGLDALVEVHDDADLERALAAGASLVGVNQRDLATFAVDGARAERMAARIPAGVVAVAESGIGGADDAARLAAAGYQAILVGESVVTAPDRAAAVAALGGHPVGTRAGHGAGQPA